MLCVLGSPTRRTPKQTQGRTKHTRIHHDMKTHKMLIATHTKRGLMIASSSLSDCGKLRFTCVSQAHKHNIVENGLIRTQKISQRTKGEKTLGHIDNDV